MTDFLINMLFLFFFFLVILVTGGIVEIYLLIKRKFQKRSESHDR